MVTYGARRSASVDPGGIIDRGRLQRRGLELAVAALALFACLWVGRDAIDRVMQTARARWFAATLTMRVMPGDAVVRSSSALEVVVAIDGVDIVAWDAPVIVSAETASGLQTFAAAATDDGRFVVTLPASLGTLTYSVRSRGLASDAYRMRVISPPRVRRVDVAYQYPGFTGLKPREQTDSGDVFAPKGTKATVRVHLADPVASGQLRFGDTSVALSPAGDGVVAGTFTVQGDAGYRVNVVTADGLANEGDPEYFVRVMDDRPPDVRLVRPGSDRKVTRLEEALIEARADDDYGLSQFELVYSVRGGAPQTVPLLRTRGAESATGTHTIYVEDLGVQPGDFISYFAQARDIARGKPSSETRSDIFFLEVRPFTEEFEAAQSQAMMAGGGAGSFDDLAGRQKDIIIATWRLDKRSGAGKSADDIRTIARSQAELKAQALQLAGRMNPPPAQARRRPPPPETAPAPPPVVAPNTPMAQAVEAMTKAQAELEKLSTTGALPHENAALNALLKAQAEQLRRQVARQQGQQGGGGQSGNQDLSALFDRELQRQQQTNYENRPQAANQNEQNSPERAADRLKELARRQEDLAREQRELARRQQQLPEEELKRRLERLTREQERLQREAEDAAKQMAQGGASAAQRNAMREAAREMAGAAGDLSKNRAGQASERSAKAGEQLRNASRALEGALPDARRRAAGDWQFDARTLAEAQRRLADAASRVAEGASPQQNASGEGQRTRPQGGQQAQSSPQQGSQQQSSQQGQSGQSSTRASRPAGPVGPARAGAGAAGPVGPGGAGWIVVGLDVGRVGPGRGGARAAGTDEGSSRDVRTGRQADPRPRRPGTRGRSPRPVATACQRAGASRRSCCSARRDAAGAARGRIARHPERAGARPCLRGVGPGARGSGHARGGRARPSGRRRRGTPGRERDHERGGRTARA